MRSFTTFLVILASCGSLVLAAPMPQVLNENAANDRANDGKNVGRCPQDKVPGHPANRARQAIENEFKIQEAVALAAAGCGRTWPTSRTP